MKPPSSTSSWTWAPKWTCYSSRTTSRAWVWAGCWGGRGGGGNSSLKKKVRRTQPKIFFFRNLCSTHITCACVRTLCTGWRITKLFDRLAGIFFNTSAESPCKAHTTKLENMLYIELCVWLVERKMEIGKRRVCNFNEEKSGDLIWNLGDWLEVFFC